MPSCDRCGRFFNSWPAYDQHIANSPRHNICDQCDIDFPTWVGLKEHWVQSPNHNYCQYCNEHFYDEEDLEDHFQNAHAYCPTCRRVFKDGVGLREHYRQSEQHHYCAPCDRLFNSASNLNSHLNSSVHRPKDVKCPFKCGAAFVSRSALVLHLENGACTSGVNRNLVNRYVRQYDTSNVITDPARMIAGSGSSGDITYIASERSWNGSGYECYLCHNTYQTLAVLNRHLASPRHQDRIYICRGPSCSARFNTLSGLVQHIESGRCGVARFKTVQNAMDSLLGQMGRLTM
ncbi:hypothetical protein GALMADRAFT_234944 [Galerina marginata CBS 339.88]|uniref:C2H2-type domain-containing protein n=1 Tax=Galerina marginata (strain CBS 339.88) TaxID=685588 RepID=A0A067U0M1_GALM3|nr:hypothetical protein GALMADRAFT_234944 [Galerina marginata CBS 339.88]